jgi:hypothetical protein
MSEREQILRDLEPMFQEAEAKGLWFHCNYQDIWFAPADLRKEHEKGSFIWGKVNWTLRNPSELTRQLEANVTDATAVLNRHRAALSKAKGEADGS